MEAAGAAAGPLREKHVNEKWSRSYELRQGRPVPRTAGHHMAGFSRLLLVVRLSSHSLFTSLLLQYLFKGTVQRDLFGWKWYQSTELSQKDWRRDH